MKIKGIFNKLLKKKETDDDLLPRKGEPLYSQLLEADDNGDKIYIYINDEKVGTHNLENNPTIVGRDPGQADIIISELIVSKKHCSIVKTQGEFIIKDLDSTNGLYIHDEKITERKIKNDDVISLGKKGTVKLVFHQGENK